MKLLSNQQSRVEFPGYEPPRLRKTWKSRWNNYPICEIGMFVTFFINLALFINYQWINPKHQDQSTAPVCSVDKHLWDTSTSNNATLDPQIFFERRDRMARFLFDRSTAGFVTAPGDLFRLAMLLFIGSELCCVNMVTIIATTQTFLKMRLKSIRLTTRRLSSF